MSSCQYACRTEYLVHSFANLRHRHYSADLLWAVPPKFKFSRDRSHPPFGIPQCSYFNLLPGGCTPNELPRESFRAPCPCSLLFVNDCRRSSPSGRSCSPSGLTCTTSSTSSRRHALSAARGCRGLRTRRTNARGAKQACCSVFCSCFPRARFLAFSAHLFLPTTDKRYVCSDGERYGNR